MEEKILQKINEGKNVLIVGKTNSGKSYFVKNKIIPLLEKNNLKISYSENCEILKTISHCDVYIVDEAEILFDKEFLENIHPKENPYYTKSYLRKVKSWHKKLSKITKPIICIVTRNSTKEIDNIYKNYKSLEWNNLPVEIFKFEKDKINNMQKISPQHLKQLLDLIYTAHQKHNTKKDFRQDGKVPFIVHPIWCALTILNDQRIPFEEREIGYQVLLLHDILEDTSLKIPDYIDPKVLEFVKEMTHETWEEEQNIENKSAFIKLLKLCDKIASMYDETVRNEPQRRKEWKNLTRKLLNDVESHYGNIRLVTLSKAILNDSNW